MISLSFSNTRRLEITECEWKDIQTAIRSEVHSYGCFDGAEFVAGAASHNGQGWVSAQTKPEEDKNVLAIGPTWIEPIVCFWDGIGWTQYETSFDATSEITHWQPLPAPPSEADELQTKDNQ